MLGPGEKWEIRRSRGWQRVLPRTPEHPPKDFSSNDYLGLASSGLLLEKLRILLGNEDPTVLRVGSTGSRLISGNSSRHVELENRIGAFHKSPGALLFNSGYCANLGLLTGLCGPGDVVLYDQQIHASLRDGLKLARAASFSFRHNDLDHLKYRLVRQTPTNRRIFVAVESLYSMAGDLAPLAEIAELCERFKAHLLVDEAHSGGVLGPEGRGLVVDLGLEQGVLARTFTYGKAFGCGGASICATNEVLAQIMNFANSFVYTTALAPLQVALIDSAYDLMPELESARQKLRFNIDTFLGQSRHSSWGAQLLPSVSPIQSVLGEPEKLLKVQEAAQSLGLDIRRILSPTVQKGTERLRIILHSHNVPEDIVQLGRLLEEQW